MGDSSSILIQTLPAFVINLDRRPDRWKEFQSQPSYKQFTNIQRYSAFDGKMHDWIHDDNISIHTKENIHNNYRRSHYEINTVGAIGATYSHVGIWKKFLESGEPYCLVFEDDTVIHPEEITKINYLLKSIPHGWNLFLLGHHNWMMKSTPIDKKKEKGGWYNVQSFTGAHAYIISREAAQKLVEKPFPIETHIEFYMSACARQKLFNIVRYEGLRVGYGSEDADENDSDTFDTAKSCPVCYVPDDLPKQGFYMSYEKMARMMVGIGAFAFVYYGWIKGQGKV
jgi:hypothetical protein